MEQILKQPFEQLRKSLNSQQQQQLLPPSQKQRIDDQNENKFQIRNKSKQLNDSQIQLQLNLNNKNINDDENYQSGASCEDENQRLSNKLNGNDLNLEGSEQSSKSGLNFDQLYFENRKANSFMSDMDYFKQDSCDFDCYIEQNKTKKYQKKLENSNTYASWMWSQFFEFFFYHLIYFIFGPFCIIFFYPFNGWYIYKNLSFGLYGKFAFLQMLLWFLNLSSTIAYFSSSEEREHFEFFMIYNNWILLLFRVFSISCRYAMSHPLQIELYKTTFIDKDEMVKDLYLANWKTQNNQTVIEELFFASKRDEVDLSMFYCQFFQDINQNEIKESLENLKKLHIEFSNEHRKKLNLLQKMDESNDQQQQEDQKQIQKVVSQEQLSQDKCQIMQSTNSNNFNGMIILHYLINQFNKLYPIYNKAFIPLLFGFLRSMIWIVFFCIYNQDILTELHWSEYLLGCTISLFHFFIFYLCSKFLITEIADIHRVYYLNIQMLFLIKPKKDEQFICYKKVLPTLNVTCYDTYKNWMQLRRLTIEYGKRFWLRGQANASFMLLYSLYPIVFIFLHLLQIFHFCELNLWYLVYDFAIIFTCVSVSLYYTASINHQFIYHTQILEEIRIIFRNLMREDFIFQNDEYCSYLYRTLLKKLRVKFSNNKQIIINHVRNVVSSIDNVKNELALLQNTQPFEFFGMKITFTMLKNSILFMISLLTFAVNVYIKTHKD